MYKGVLLLRKGKLFRQVLEFSGRMQGCCSVECSDPPRIVEANNHESWHYLPPEHWAMGQCVQFTHGYLLVSVMLGCSDTPTGRAGLNLLRWLDGLGLTICLHLSCCFFLLRVQIFVLGEQKGGGEH